MLNIMDFFLVVAKMLGVAHMDPIFLNVVLLALIPSVTNIAYKLWAKLWSIVFYRWILGFLFHREVAAAQTEASPVSSQINRVVNNDTLIEIVLAYVAYLTGLSMLTESDQVKSNKSIATGGFDAKHCPETVQFPPFTLPDARDLRYAAFQYAPRTWSMLEKPFLHSAVTAEGRVKSNGAHLARYLVDNYSLSLVPATDRALQVEPGLFICYKHTPSVSQNAPVEGQAADGVSPSSDLGWTQVTQSRHDTVEGLLLGDLLAKLNSQEDGCVSAESAELEDSPGDVEGRTNRKAPDRETEPQSSCASSSDSDASSNDSNDAGDGGGGRSHSTPNTGMRQIILYCRELVGLKECEAYLYHFRRRLNMGLEGVLGRDLGIAELDNPLAPEHRIVSFLRRAQQWYMSQLRDSAHAEFYFVNPIPTEANIGPDMRLTESVQDAIPERSRDGECDASEEVGIARLVVHRYPLHWDGMHGKTFNGLFFSQKDILLRTLRDFRDRSGKFAVPGASRHLSLLCGPSGTGKTSLVKAMARYLKRHIVFLQLENFRTVASMQVWMDRLVVRCCGEEETVVCADRVDSCSDSVRTLRENLFTLDPGEVIYLVEDLTIDKEAEQRQERDCSRGGHLQQYNSCKSDFGKKRPHESLEGRELSDETNDARSSVAVQLEHESRWHYVHRPKLDMNGVLGALDGVATPDGRLVVLTTACAKSLDPQLLHSGVVALIVHLKGLDWEQAVEMIQYHFPEETLTVQDIERIRVALGHLCLTKKQLDKRRDPARDDMDSTLANAHPHESQINPCDLEQICAGYNSVSKLIEGLESGRIGFSDDLF